MKKKIDVLTNFVNNFQKNLEYKIKADKIFKETDKFSYKDFNKLINISENRLKNIKNGRDLNEEIKLNSNEYKKVGRNIFNKNIYTDSQNLYKYKNELKLSEYLNFIKDKKFIKNFRKNNWNSTENINENEQKNSLNNKSEKNIFYMKDKLKTFIEDDKNILDVNLKKYKNNIKNIIKFEKKKKGDEFEKEFNNIKKNILLLNFKKNANEIKKKKNLIFNKNIYKLFKYNRDLRENEKNIFTFKKNNSALIESNNLLNNNENKNIFINSSKNLKETIDVVKNEYYYDSDLINNLEIKKEKINNLTQYNYPKHLKYKKLKNFNFEKIKQKSQNNETNKIDLNYLTNNFNSNIFLDNLYDIYKNKKKIWKENDKLIENEKELKEKEFNNNLMYLKELKMIKRKPFNYIDLYSNRSEINLQLKEICKILGSKNYSKKEINDIVIKYFDEYLIKLKKGDEINKVKTPKEQKNYFFKFNFDNNNKILDKNGNDENGNNNKINLKAYSKIFEKTNYNKNKRKNSNYLEYLENKKMFFNQTNYKNKSI